MRANTVVAAIPYTSAARAGRLVRELGRAVRLGEPGSRRTGAPDAEHEREASAGADEHVLRSDVAVDDRRGVRVEVVERAGGRLEAAQHGAEREAGIAALGDELPERRALDPGP